MISLVEVWKDIPGYEGYYRVSDMGRVKSLAHSHPRILKPWIANTGYPCVGLSGDKNKGKYLVHRLVAAAFIPNPDGKPQVNHKNGIKADSRAANLEWCDNQENALHSAYILRNESTIKKRPVTCLDTGITYASVSEAARAVGGCNQNIVKCCKGERRIAKGRRWAYAEEVSE